MLQLHACPLLLHACGQVCLCLRVYTRMHKRVLCEPEREVVCVTGALLEARLDKRHFEFISGRPNAPSRGVSLKTVTSDLKEKAEGDCSRLPIVVEFDAPSEHYWAYPSYSAERSVPDWLEEQLDELEKEKASSQVRRRSSKARAASKAKAASPKAASRGRAR